MPTLVIYHKERGLEASLPKDLLKAVTEAVPPASMCVRPESI